MYMTKSLIALFPAIAAGVSSYALFSDAATVSKHLAVAGDIVPTGGLDILRDEITRIAAKSDGRLTLGFLLGLGIALGSANREKQRHQVASSAKAWSPTRRSSQMIRMRPRFSSSS
jgi:uncharacterized BrkB/YihY/UPF0761 family membrane protein